MTSHAVRRIRQHYHRPLNSPLIAKVFRANKRLISQYSIDQHQIRGFVNTLKDERKRRIRNKRLNLVKQEDNGPQFFSPSRIEAARAYQVSKDAQLAQKQQNIQAKKATAASNKIRKIYKRKIATERSL